MKQIQEWLGHSTFNTTAAIYSHLDFTSKQESANAIVAAFTPEEQKEETPDLGMAMHLMQDKVLFQNQKNTRPCCVPCHHDIQNRKKP